MLFRLSDAEDAVKARDGYDYDGYRLRVEFPRGGGAGNHRSNRSERSRNNRGAVTKRSQYRVLVSGLPPSGTVLIFHRQLMMQKMINFLLLYFRLLARFKRSYAWSWWCMFCWYIQRWYRCRWIPSLWRYEICNQKTGWFTL